MADLSFYLLYLTYCTGTTVCKYILFELLFSTFIFRSLNKPKQIFMAPLVIIYYNMHISFVKMAFIVLSMMVVLSAQIWEQYVYIYCLFVCELFPLCLWG